MAAPSTTCVDGYTAHKRVHQTPALQKANRDNRMVIVFSVSTSKNEISTSTTNSARSLSLLPRRWKYLSARRLMMTIKLAVSIIIHQQHPAARIASAHPRQTPPGSRAGERPASPPTTPIMLARAAGNAPIGFIRTGIKR